MGKHRCHHHPTGGIIGELTELAKKEAKKGYEKGKEAVDKKGKELAKRVASTEGITQGIRSTVSRAADLLDSYKTPDLPKIPGLLSLDEKEQLLNAVAEGKTIGEAPGVYP